VCRDPAARAQPALAQLHQRLALLVDAEARRYERILGPVPPPSVPPPTLGPSLGSIFTNATQTSAEASRANAAHKQVETLTCVHCGGPQERPLDFRCKYCGRPIAGAVKQTL